MEQYERRDPEFSLCGLNCSLCPRFNADGSSKCPGCGGIGFSTKHPSCKVINCSKRNGMPEYCFECQKFPCQRYENIGECDSFISYFNVWRDLGRAREDIEGYLKELKRKKDCLDYLLEKCDDGRSKGYYCLAVNLLSVRDVEHIVKMAREIEPTEDLKEKAKAIRKQFEEKAEEDNVKIALRKRSE